MFKKEGFWDVVPQIKSVSFPLRGKWQVDLVDGRSIIMPISAFPSLKRISSKERKNWYLIGGGVTWMLVLKSFMSSSFLATTRNIHMKLKDNAPLPP